MRAPPSRSPAPPAGTFGRTSTSVILLVLGLIVLAMGTLCLYAKRNVLDANRLSDTAVSALDRAQVRRYLAHEAAGQVIAHVPQLGADRATIERATRAIVSSRPFRSLVRGAIVATEHAVVDNGVDDTVMKLQHVGTLVRGRLQQVDPALAAKVPADLSTRIASLGHAPLLTNALQAIKDVDLLGTILPPIAVALLIASVLAGASRRAAAVRLGLGLLVWGVAGFILMELGRAAALDAVPAGIQRDAAGPVWDEITGQLRVWFLVAAAAGLGLAVLAYWLGRANRDPAVA